MDDSTSDRAFGAVLCDLDGVLRLWDPDAMPGLDLAWGLPTGTLARAAFRPERLESAVTGQVTDEEWRALVAADLAGPCNTLPRAQALVAAWSEALGQVDARVLGLLTRARRDAPVVLVSNATTRLESDLAALGLAEAFDAVVNTARIGHCKPDPYVFEHAAALVGVPVQQCLFVDDTLDHVEAARALGMRGLHYRDADQLRTALGR